MAVTTLVLARTNAVREFLDAGRTFIRLPESSRLAREVSEGFARFIDTVPPALRREWTFNVPGNEDPDGKPDDGYLERHGERKVNGGRFDDKFIFHFRPRLWNLLREREVYPCGWMFDWLEAYDALWNLCYRAADSLLAELDREMAGYDLLTRFRAASELHVIRTLLYSERGVEDPLVVGKAHTDRNLLTLQVAESRPGLRIYPKGSDSSGLAIPYEAEPDFVLAFPGQKFEALVGPDKVQAIWHDIVNADPVAPKRSSVIFFAHV